MSTIATVDTLILCTLFMRQLAKQRNLHAYSLISIALFIFISPVCFADETSAAIESPSSFSWLREKRNEWGQLIGDTGQRLNGFFADSNAIDNRSDSFVKLGVKAVQNIEGHAELRPILKFKLDLPALEDRLKLVFESRPAETQSLEQNQRERSIPNNEKIKDTAIGGLELKLKSSHDWYASTSAGVDFHFPFDPFWRARGDYRWQMSEHWLFNARQSLYYFHSEGWGESSQFIFERDYNDHILRSKSEARYRYDERIMEFAQVWSWLKELNPKLAVEAQLGLLAENQPQPRTTAYYINSSYRRKLISNWLFFEITPELLFPRDRHFKATPSLSGKIEIVFSSSK